MSGLAFAFESKGLMDSFEPNDFVLDFTSNFWISKGADGKSRWDRVHGGVTRGIRMASIELKATDVLLAFDDYVVSHLPKGVRVVVDNFGALGREMGVMVAKKFETLMVHKWKDGPMVFLNFNDDAADE